MKRDDDRDDDRDKDKPLNRSLLKEIHGKGYDLQAQGLQEDKRLRVRPTAEHGIPRNANNRFRWGELICPGHYQSLRVCGGYCSLVFICLTIYTMSLIKNMVIRNIKSPNKIGIQNPARSKLFRPVEIEIIEIRIR